MAREIGDYQMQQGGGALPTMLSSGSSAGESGVSVLNLRFRGGAHFSAKPRRHLIWFQMSPLTRFECRMAGRLLGHDVPTGTLAICPAGIDCACDTDESVDAILIVIDPSQLAFAAAEGSALEAQLVERFSGRDPTLLELACILACETAGGYANGPLFWNDVASTFTGGLVARHTSRRPGQPRGMLGNSVFEQLRDYIVAHLDRPIEVPALAKLAGRSPFHFSRVFTRSVGVTPHRYVVHLRLRRAIELIREKRFGLAEIAARTGFADQSHLSRWARRVHGVPLTQLAAAAE
jgi:AraC family transcriptional regulator